MAARMNRAIFRREAGNPAVEVLDNLHRSVSNPTSSSCQQYLRLDCTTGDLPDFLTDSFYVINREAEDLDLRDHLVAEEAMIVTDVNQQGIFNVPEEYQFRRLINLLSLSKCARGSSLMIASAIIGYHNLT